MTVHALDSLQQLPVHARRDEILQAVDRHQVTIITAETGAGKSTQVPQYLAEHGYRKVIVTQPRILAARNLAMRVREEYSLRCGTDMTEAVGYRTAHERDDHPDNVILYCTDGLQLVRELTGSGTRKQQVLVLDEVHEWNENMEVLVAWAKKRCAEEPSFKIVLMSATMEADDLASYFDAPKPIAVPGRTFPVEKRHGKEVVSEVLAQLEAGPRNMLVFLPGKAEIESVGAAVKSGTALNVPIIPLHGQLEPEAQQRAFASYPQGKVILTTNVAQTSITIDDIDVVIDSGLERRAEVRSGVEGLFIAEISQADCLQRAGRAGRTKEGLYVLAQLGNLPCSPLEERPAYGIPEIMRKLIDRVVLRLASIGIDIEDLEFFHSPSRKSIRLAKKTLVSLGALTRSGEITPIGARMERFPVASSYARMLVEAEPYPPEVQAKLAAIIAIQEVGGIVKGGPRYTGWRRLTRQTSSDLLAEYEVFLALPSLDPEEFDELGIIAKNVAKAEEVQERLRRDLGLSEVPLSPIVTDDIEPLLRSIVAGQLHELWMMAPNREVVHVATKKKRELSNGTVVKSAHLVVGTPFDLEVPTPKGLETLHLLNGITAVDPSWLDELAPETFQVRPGGVYFDSHYGTLAESTLVRFGNHSFQASGAPILARTPGNQRLFISLYSRWLHERLKKERKALEMVNFRTIPDVPLRQIEARVREVADGVVSLLELSRAEKVELSKLGSLEAYFGEDFAEGLNPVGSGAPRRQKQRRPRGIPTGKRGYGRGRRR